MQSVKNFKEYEDYDFEEDIPEPAYLKVICLFIIIII